MTDKIKAITVVLEPNILEYDAGEIVSAISLLKGVVSVQPHIADGSSDIEREQAKHEIWKKICDIIFE